MIIHSIQLENFRSFYGTQKIEFAVDENKNTTFIWADNNVGKTNLLNAITWCLHTQFTSSFKRRDDLLNHQAKTEGVNNYSVTIIFEETDKYYSVKRMGGSFTGFNLHEITNSGDFKKIDNESIFINSIIPKEMMKYFIIDGEGISESVDDKGQISASRSIKDILGFQVAEKTLEDIKVIRREHTRELTNLDVSSKLSDAQRKFDDFDRQYQNRLNEKKSLEEALCRYREGFEKADQYLKNSNHEVVKIKTQQRQSLSNELASLESRINQLENQKIGLVRKYSWVAFSNNLSNEAMSFIDENQYKGTIPAPFNQSLIKDIIDEASCICGAEVKPGTDAYQKIIEMLGKAANPDILNRIARARSQLQVIKNYSTEAVDDIAMNMSEIKVAKDKVTQVKNSIESISIEIMDVDNEKIKHYEAEYKRNSNQINVTERQIGSKESEISNLLSEKIKLDDLIKRLSALSPKASELRKKIEFIDEIQKVIETELDSAFDKIKIELVSKMNSFMKAHLADNLLIKITDDFKVGLYSKDGKLMAPGGGLTAMLSLVFISTLISIARIRKNASGNILTPGAIAPIILDAPFSKLSDTYAPKLAAALPSNADQLIIFMYDGNAKGGEKIIRQNGHLGKEYYLLKQVIGSGEDKPSSYLTIGDKKYSLNEYNQERDTVCVREVMPDV